MWGAGLLAGLRRSKVQLMRYCVSQWFISWAAIGSMAFPAAIHAQVPMRHASCPPYQGLGAETQITGGGIKLRRVDSGEVVIERRIRIEDVTIDGAPDLEQTIRKEINDWMENNGPEGDSVSIQALEETVKKVLQDNGYFNAKVTAQPQILENDLEKDDVALHFEVAGGLQYRLRDIQFSNVSVFPPEKLRAEFAIQDGEPFNMSKIRRGLETLTVLYGSQGFINFTADPNIEVNNEDQSLSLDIKCEENNQFRVGTVQALGFDPEVSHHNLKIKLKPGDIFNNDLINEFYKDNKSILPPDVHPSGDTYVKQNPLDNTVAIVFDVRACP